MKIEYKPIAEVRPYSKNPRKVEAAVGKVEESISKFGFNVPILIDKNGEIVAGHTRYYAASNLGLKTVPCIVLDDLTEKQIRQFRIVDNKVGEQSSWDYEKLLEELGEIDEIDMGAFDLGGFEEMPDADMESNLDEGVEISVGSFSDEAFSIECPFCGFRFDE